VSRAVKLVLQRFRDFLPAPFVNPRRGELRLVIDGKARRLRLTLSALAYLESLYDGKNILLLTKDFATQGMCARDVICVLQAGLYGAGEGEMISDNIKANTDDATNTSCAFDIEGGYARASEAAAQLLEVAFLVAE